MPLFCMSYYGAAASQMLLSQPTLIYRKKLIQTVLTDIPLNAITSLQDSISAFIACHIPINAYNVANRVFITLKYRYQFQHSVIL
ncbi:hypothetical protein GMJAKD_03855 [Candidatus Electrothrix aarhusensis]